VLCLAGFEPIPEPLQPARLGLGRHPPPPVLLAAQLLAVASLLGLSGGLPADLQGIANLTPGAALVACCQDQEPDRIVDALLGVSRGLQVLQGALGASPGLLEVLDGSTQQPTGMTAGLGAHVNARCHRFGVRGAESATTSIDVDKGASNSKQLHSSGALHGAPVGHTFLISSHISARGDHRATSGQPKRSPAGAGTPRGVDASGVI
jgi:hypothetical protein